MSTMDVKLPELGEGVTEGELIKWLVKPGDQVKADQPIAEVMTDKATVEVPSPVAGTVQELKFKAGDVIKVESIMIKLSTSGQSNSNTSMALTSTASANASSSTAVASNANKPEGVRPVKLPELGEGVTEGELIKWLVKPGDQVKADQPIAEVMTDKATVEVPSPIAGVVHDLKFKAGDVVKVESIMLTLVGAAGTANAAAATSHNPPSASATTSQAHSPQVVNSVAKTVSPMTASTSSAVFPPVADSKVLATPSTRRFARESGVDINQLSGSGLAGRVTREDVMKVTSGSIAGSTSNSKPQFTTPSYNSAAPLAALEERVELRGIRKKIAENLQMSKSIIPHFTLMDEADVTTLADFRESLKSFAESKGTKITYLPIVMKALIATIKEFPMFNASIDDAASQIVYKNYFNIGFAADTPNGLVVPVIKNADQKNIIEISKEILDLSKRARDGKLKPDEMKGATITITNIGSVGGTYATPIINHPEVAILGMYKIQDKPVIKNGALATIKSMNYTITCDHRLIDGAVAANFLKAFFARIQNPAVLMVEMK